jgi:uncharacterized membrane protein
VEAAGIVPGVTDEGSGTVYRSEHVAFMIAASVLGGVLLVIGIVALARTGVPAEALTEATAAVGPFTRTPLMAIIEIALGLIIVVASAAGEKGSLLGVGVVSLVFGIVWLIEPGAFGELLGVGRSSAALYLLVGLVVVVAGILATPGRTVVRERVDP